VYRSILPRLKRDRFGSGFSSPSYNRSLTHTEDLFRDLAIDLGVEWYSLQTDLQQSDASVRRVVREYMEEAAVELEAYVASLPRPVCEVLVLKSCGLSWKRVMEGLPHRVHYSVMDDWKLGLARVWREREDLVRRLV